MKKHLPEYLSEAAALGLFMISASVFGTLLEHLQSPLQPIVPDALARRALAGVAMGLTAIAIIYSRFGALSGAHMNPAVTLAFARLGKVRRFDAGCYILAQFAGALAGMLAAWAIIGRPLTEPAVDFVITRPGPAGLAAAAAGEFVISFVMMSVVLRVAAGRRTMRWAGAAAGLLVMLSITIEGPLSGMSMNPARTLAPALLSGRFDAIWIYFLMPPLGMLLAAELFRRRATGAVCAKLNHAPDVRCIFCGFDPRAKDLCITTSSSSAAAPAAAPSPITSRRAGSAF